MKTVLAPMFAHRNLKVLSWVGHNIFGNRDGLVLDDPANKSSKIETKDQVITEILGYKPETHVSIEYIDMDDWKTAWDHIHFQGFLGTKMILQFTWQGCDSLLAAPLVIDLARLADLEKRRGGRGLMRHLACFFKSPVGVEEHDFLQAVRRRPDPSTTRQQIKGVLMQLAFSTNAYLKYPFDEAAARIASIGYEGLELLADVPHAWPAGLLEGQKRQIRRAMERVGLEFSNINAFMMNAIDDHRQPYWHPSFIEPERHYRQVRIDHTRRALSLCAELGAPHITTEPGGPLAPGQSRQQAIDLFVEVLKPLAEHAENLGVLLLIEPEPGLLLETTDQYLEVAERLNAPSIGLNFDVGHALLRERRPARGHRQAGAAHPPLPPRGHRGEPGASSPGSRHRRDRLRRGDRGHPRDRLRRLADGRALSVPGRPRRRRAASPGGAASAGRIDTRSSVDQETTMTRSLLPFLKLIRLPNVLTAAADSLAGWLLVGGALGAVGGWLPLAVASMVLYAAGMALNDVFDLEIDRVERPARPIPSGQVSRGFAIRFGAGGLVLGPLVALASGSVAAPDRRGAAGWGDPGLRRRNQAVGPGSRNHGLVPGFEPLAGDDPCPCLGRAGGLAGRGSLRPVRRRDHLDQSLRNGEWTDPQPATRPWSSECGDRGTVGRGASARVFP